jgi:hypothetical protein
MSRAESRDSVTTPKNKDTTLKDWILQFRLQTQMMRRQTAAGGSQASGSTLIGPSSTPAPVPGAVPTTSPLIRAVDRIAMMYRGYRYLGLRRPQEEKILVVKENKNEGKETDTGRVIDGRIIPYQIFYHTTYASYD